MFTPVELPVDGLLDRSLALPMVSENGRGTEPTKSVSRKRARADRGRLKRAEARGAIAMLLERAHRWRSLRVQQIAADLAEVLLGSPRVRAVMVRAEAGAGRTVDVVRGREELEAGLRAELDRSPGGAASTG